MAGRTCVEDVTTAATVCAAPKRHMLDPTTKPLPRMVTEVPPVEGPLGGCREAKIGNPLPSRASPRRSQHNTARAILVARLD